MLEIVFTIVLFLFILTAIIVIHEFGHFITAKYFGVQVDEFSIGMGPLVAKKVWHSTQYSIRAFPVGGYVKMLGEGETIEQAGSFSILKPWKRFIIIYAGVVMNLFLAALVFSIIAVKNDGVFFGASIDPNYHYPIGDTQISKLGSAGAQVDSPAEKVGVKTGDILNKVNNIDYKSLDEFSKILEENNNKEIPFEFVPYLGGDKRTLNILVRDRAQYNLSDKQARTGIVLSGITYTRIEYNGIAKPFAGVLQTVNSTHNYLATLGFIIDQAIKQKDASIVSNSLSSPVGVYAVTKKVLDLNGFWGIMTLVAILSLTIGVMNAIPFPALDGWHGIFIIIEGFTKKKVNEKLYNAITLAGFVLLLGLGILIAVKDVLNFNNLF